MIDNIVNKNIIFLQNHGVKMDSEDDKAIYKYGLQILYYYIIDLVVIFLLASFFGKLYETVIMTLIFGLFQVFGGGYHAKTPFSCLSAMVVGAFFANICIVMIADMLTCNIISAFVISGFILKKTPVTNKKHPVSKKIQKRSKVIVRIITMLILIVILALSYFNRTDEIVIITVAMGLYVISLITKMLTK